MKFETEVAVIVTIIGSQGSCLAGINSPYDYFLMVNTGLVDIWSEKGFIDFRGTLM